MLRLGTWHNTGRNGALTCPTHGPQYTGVLLYGENTPSRDADYCRECVVKLLLDSNLKPLENY